MSVFVKFVQGSRVVAQYEVTHELTEAALLPLMPPNIFLPDEKFRAIIVEADSHALADIAIREKIAKLEPQLN